MSNSPRLNSVTTVVAAGNNRPASGPCSSFAKRLPIQLPSEYTRSRFVSRRAHGELAFTEEYQRESLGQVRFAGH